MPWFLHRGCKTSGRVSSASPRPRVLVPSCMVDGDVTAVPLHTRSPQRTAVPSPRPEAEEPGTRAGT